MPKRRSSRQRESLQGHVVQVIRQKPRDGVIIFIADFYTLTWPTKIVGFGGPGGCGHSGVITPGDWFECTGRWNVHTRYGLSFAADQLTAQPQTTHAGLILLLGSGLITGLGPTVAERIVRHFGTDALQVLEQEQAALLQIPGLGTKRLQQIVTGWRQYKILEQYRQAAYGLGVDPVLMNRVFGVLGNRALDVMKRDPYGLFDNNVLTFWQADEIALCLGESRGSLRRARACLRNFLLVLADWREEWEGPRAELLDKASAKLGLPMDLLDEALDQEIHDGSIIETAAAIRKRPRSDVTPCSSTGGTLADIYEAMGFSFEEAQAQVWALTESCDPTWKVHRRRTEVRGAGDRARAS